MIGSNDYFITWYGEDNNQGHKGSSALTEDCQSPGCKSHLIYERFSAETAKIHAETRIEG